MILRETLGFERNTNNYFRLKIILKENKWNEQAKKLREKIIQSKMVWKIDIFGSVTFGVGIYFFESYQFTLLTIWAYAPEVLNLNDPQWNWGSKL